MNHPPEHQIPGSRHPRIGPLRLLPGEIALTDNEIDVLLKSVAQRFSKCDAIYSEAIAKGIVDAA